MKPQNFYLNSSTPLSLAPSIFLAMKLLYIIQKLRKAVIEVFWYPTLLCSKHFLQHFECSNQLWCNMFYWHTYCGNTRHIHALKFQKIQYGTKRKIALYLGFYWKPYTASKAFLLPSKNYNKVIRSNYLP